MKPLATRLAPLFARVPAIVSLLVTLCGAIVLLGWQLDVPLMRTMLHNAPTPMNPATAICFALAATSLWLQRERAGRFAILAKCLAAAIAFVALLRLLGYLLGGEARIDEILYRSKLNGNVMAPNTAICFALYSAALIILDFRTPRRRAHPATFLILICASVALLSIIGYLFRIGMLYGVKGYIPMALNTAICFALLCIGVLCARPDREPVRTLLDDTVGGAIARRLVPAAFGLPIILGYLRLLGERRGWFTSDFGLTLFVVFLMLILNIIVWTLARVQRRTDLGRRSTELALRQSETRFRQIIATANDAFVAMDADGEIIDWNPQAETIFGYTRYQAIGRNLAETIIPERYRAAHAQGLQKFLSTGEGPVLGRRIELSALHINGREFPIEITIAPAREGSTTIFFAFVHDITKRKRAEEERERFFTLSLDLVCVAGFDGYFKRVNPSFERILGYTPQEMTSKPWLDFTHPDDIQRTIEAGNQVTRGELILHFENRFRCKDGSFKWLSWTSVPVVKEALIYAIARDMTELKQAQSALVQTEKLAGLGQMVAGVAHEINNPLAFVSNNVAVLQRDLRAMTELLKLYVQADPTIASANTELATEIRDLSERMDLAYTISNLDQIITRSRDGLKRIQQIVKDLREFARLDSGDLQEADLNAGIESTINIVRGVAKKKQVVIDTQLDPLPPVKCYPAKINQVVMNLITNAIDASHENDHVTVRSSRNGESVKIEVIDTGKGIDPALQEKIFDPFFTTKKIGEGTGLGLSISYGIIKDHGGTIDVESEVGRGSRFVVTLPIGRTTRPRELSS